MSIRLLTNADLEQYFALRQISFLDTTDVADENARETLLRRLRYTRGHFLGDKLMSAAKCYPFEMFIAGTRARVGGLASVLSAPEARRRGFVRDLLQGVLRGLRDEGTGWMLEYPFDTRFYARYGFASVPTGSEITAPAERLFCGAAPDAERLSGDAPSLLEPLYQAWARHYSLTLCRDNTARPTWTRILENRICYLLEEAYVVFDLESDNMGQTLTVHDYAFSTPAGRERLFRFVGSFHGQVDSISLHMPNDEPLAFDLQRYHTNHLPILQARIVDVAAALTPLSSHTRATLRLNVRDDFCAWNDGTFRVSLGPEGSAVERTGAGTGDAATLTLTIGTLTRLVTGALSPAAALRAGLAESELQGAEALAALSGGRVPFMPGSDYF